MELLRKRECIEKIPEIFDGLILMVSSIVIGGILFHGHHKGYIQ
jgi:hypothetical protein